MRGKLLYYVSTMKVATSLSLLAVAGLGVALAGRLAVSSGQSGALVRLQSTTPGVSQSGHQGLVGVRGVLDFLKTA